MIEHDFTFQLHLIKIHCLAMVFFSQSKLPITASGFVCLQCNYHQSIVLLFKQHSFDWSGRSFLQRQHICSIWWGTLGVSSKEIPYSTSCHWNDMLNMSFLLQREKTISKSFIAVASFIFSSGLLFQISVDKVSCNFAFVQLATVPFCIEAFFSCCCCKCNWHFGWV